MDDLSAWIASLPPDWTVGCHETVFLRAREAYASPGRHYHTWRHVLDCVEKLGSMPCDEPRAVFLALVFHDAARDLLVALDIDMSILGAPPERYEAYVEGVRLEYTPAVVTAEQFAEGRSGFLARLLELPSIFSTPEGRGRWEGAARANIARELEGFEQA